MVHYIAFSQGPAKGLRHDVAILQDTSALVCHWMAWNNHEDTSVASTFSSHTGTVAHSGTAVERATKLRHAPNEKMVHRHGIEPCPPIS